MLAEVVVGAVAGLLVLGVAVVLLVKRRPLVFVADSIPESLYGEADERMTLDGDESTADLEDLVDQLPDDADGDVDVGDELTEALSDQAELDAALSDESPADEGAEEP